MRDECKTGGGMWESDLLIMTGGVQDTSKSDSGMRVDEHKLQVTNSAELQPIPGRIRINTLSGAG